MTEAVSSSDLGQIEYMKLFMQELTYQDPLKPVDNKEFMAQMAQFSALQQAVTTNEKLTQLANLTADNKAISLLGKQVNVSGGGYGTVKAIQFHNDKPPEIRVFMDKSGEVVVGLDQITEV